MGVESLMTPTGGISLHLNLADRRILGLEEMK